MPTSEALATEGLIKRYGDVPALDGLDLAAKRGSVLALLGPNGAGKTTAVRILATLLRPDGGRAVVGGFDVVREPARVRALIGLTGQFSAVDEYLTGRENLAMVGRLSHLRSREARDKAGRLLERFGLEEAGGRLVKTYSGGMRRRLDLAASLICGPRVLFLDEPTTGLDPRSRLAVWDTVREIVDEGSTVLLTTQYLEEADHLAHSVAVINKGRVVAEGTPGELKRRVGNDRLVVTVAGGLETGAKAVRAAGFDEVSTDPGSRSLTAVVTDGSRAIARVVRELDAAGLEVEDISVRTPTLDEAFLALTGDGDGDTRQGDRSPSEVPA